MSWLALFAYFSVASHAEYRTFELSIENTEKGTSRAVLSTLDHIQYPTYNPLHKDEIVRLQDSWMCWENMAHYRKPCSKPEDSPTLGGKPTL